MKIRSFLHKGLHRLYAENAPRILPPGSVDKLRKMLGYLESIETASELRLVPVWKAHLLTGARKGTWSLHVTRNWRLTFRIDDSQHEVFDLNFEDYH